MKSFILVGKGEYGLGGVLYLGNACLLGSEARNSHAWQLNWAGNLTWATGLVPRKRNPLWPRQPQLGIDENSMSLLSLYFQLRSS